jgi:hypothetical protein
MRHFLSIAVVAFSLALPVHAHEIAFEKIVLNDQFVSEGAHFADFDHDGHNDVCAGPYIWKGPRFQDKYEFTKPADTPYDAAKGYSDYFLSYTHDFNKDGWSDILVYSCPGLF